MRSILEDDWRPKVTRIDDPIADDYWYYVTPRGKERIVRLTVGRPVPWPRARAWYCPVKIQGYTRGIDVAFGSGPVDALMNAMVRVRKFFFQVLPAPQAKPRPTPRKRSRAAAARRKNVPGTAEPRATKKPNKGHRKPRAR